MTCDLLQGNSDYASTESYAADSKCLFNMAKLSLMSKTILQLRSFCACSYPFPFNRSYHSLLCNLKVRRARKSSAARAHALLFSSIQRPMVVPPPPPSQVMGEEECYRRSKQYEAPAN